MDIQRKHLFNPTTGALVAFALQFFLFQLTESLVNDQAAALFGATTVNAVYAAGLFSTASGYLLFAILSRRICSIVIRRVILVFMGAIYLFFAICMVRVMQPLAFVACALAGLLSAGYIGGMVHWILASVLWNGKYSGRVIGAAIAGGIGVQYLVQNLLPLLLALLVWFALIRTKSCLQNANIIPTTNCMFSFLGKRLCCCVI